MKFISASEMLLAIFLFHRKLGIELFNFAIFVIGSKHLFGIHQLVLG